MKEFVKDFPATSFLLGLTALLFLIMQLVYLGHATSAEAIFNMGGLYGAYIKVYPEQSWRLVTAIFVHIGWEHFLLNIGALYIFGRLAESIWGSAYFLVLYMLSGIFANALTLLWTPTVLAAGASTSLFGLLGAIILVTYQSKQPYWQELSRSYQGLVVVNIIFNLFMPNVSLIGHIGGLLGGCLVAMFLPNRVSVKPLGYRLVFLGLYLLSLVVIFFYGLSY